MLQVVHFNRGMLDDKTCKEDKEIVSVVRAVTSFVFRNTDKVERKIVAVSIRAVNLRGISVLFSAF